MTSMFDFDDNDYNCAFVMLSSISSRNEKTETLKMMLDEHPVLQRVCELALNPFILFGVSTMPKQRKFHDYINLDEALDILESYIGNNHSNEQVENLQNLADRVSPSNWEVLKKIVEKDLKCGISIKSYNKVAEKKVPEYPCLLVSAYDEKKLQKLFDKADQNELFCQLKCDGMRVNIVVDENLNVTLYSRSGRVIELKDDSFYNIFKNPVLRGYVLDGELLIDGNSEGHGAERQIGNGILNKAVKGTITEEESKRVTAHLWDIISLEDFKKGKSEIPYIDRLFDLRNKIYIQLSGKEKAKRVFDVPFHFVHSIEESLSYASEWMDQGLEGAVVKSLNMFWENKRTTQAFKIKGEEECDLLCTDWIEGDGKYQGMLGALTCVSKDGTLIVNIGTGFTDDMRKTIKRDDVLGKIITVKYNTLIQDKKTKVKSLFLPRFVEIREDKAEADVL